MLGQSGIWLVSQSTSQPASQSVSLSISQSLSPVEFELTTHSPWFWHQEKIELYPTANFILLPILLSLLQTIELSRYVQSVYPFTYFPVLKIVLLTL